MTRTTGVPANLNQKAVEKPAVGGDDFGPWMLARKSARRSSAAKQNPNSADAKNVDTKLKQIADSVEKAMGSRFSIMMEDNVEEILGADSSYETNHVNEELSIIDVGPADMATGGMTSVTSMGPRIARQKNVNKGITVNKSRQTLTSVNNKVNYKKDGKVVGPTLGKENRLNSIALKDGISKTQKIYQLSQ